MVQFAFILYFQKDIDLFSFINLKKIIFLLQLLIVLYKVLLFVVRK